MKTITLLLSLFTITTLMGQDHLTEPLPYHEIPEAPANYMAGSMLARTVDGLGYRYYWATKDLTEKDLNYKPSADARTTLETMQHLYGLSEMIVNGPQGIANVRPVDYSKMGYEELRSKTLLNFKKTSDLYTGKMAVEVEKMTIKFSANGKESEFPLWNMINGPISDAIYHTGQVVSFRRSSGNPMHSGVNVFIGKTKE